MIYGDYYSDPDDDLGTDDPLITLLVLGVAITTAVLISLAGAGAGVRACVKAVAR